MRMTRRELLWGAGAGALGVLLVSCTPTPDPTPTPTPSPMPLPDTLVPAPAGSIRSSWATDPFACGAASYTRIGVQASTRETLAEPVENRLFFAGEATDADAPGTLLGAFRSGESAAMRVRASAAPAERIAVIGAGLAGAAAVARLADSDIEITVFEARDRVGGRTDTRTGGDWPIAVQLGGWLRSAASEDELPVTVETTDLATALWRTTATADTAAADIDPVANTPLETAIAAAQQSPTDMALAEALVAAGADPESDDLAALLAYLSTTAGADADVLSSWFPPALPADALQAVTGDFAAGIRELLGEAQLSLSSPVTRIAYDDAGVSLRLGTGESTSFDRVIITVPLGVLQQEGIEFSPALPFTHRGAINALGMGDIETIWMRYDEPFWDTDATIWHVVGGEGLVRTWINLLPATGENVIVGIVGGSDATDFAELGDDEALLAALTSLVPLLPAAATG